MFVLLGANVKIAIFSIIAPTDKDKREAEGDKWKEGHTLDEPGKLQPPTKSPQSQKAYDKG